MLSAKHATFGFSGVLGGSNRNFGLKKNAMTSNFCTLATMNSIFQFFCACRRTLATMTSIFFRLPADFSYNEFKFSNFWRLPAHFSYNEFKFHFFAPAGAL
jgi:hypothetical protein